MFMKWALHVGSLVNHKISGGCDRAQPPPQKRYLVIHMEMCTHKVNGELVGEIVFFINGTSST